VFQERAALTIATMPARIVSVRLGWTAGPSLSTPETTSRLLSLRMMLIQPVRDGHLSIPGARLFGSETAFAAWFDLGT
jgi:hypothetical protein